MRPSVQSLNDPAHTPAGPRVPLPLRNCGAPAVHQGQLDKGYDHNFALFGLDRNARYIVRGGMASPTSVTGDDMGTASSWLALYWIQCMESDPGFVQPGLPRMSLICNLFGPAP